MGMGGAYASGAGMIQKEDSYVPLMRSYTDMARVTSPTSGGMGGRPSYGRRGGGGSSAANEIQRRTTPEEMADVGYRREKEETSGERRTREFDEMRAWKKEEAGRRTREFNAMRASERADSGLKERDVRIREKKESREGKKEERKISEEDRIQDHADMMLDWGNRNYKSVEEWFKKSGKGDEAPMFGPTDDPNMVEVKWPGQIESEIVSRDVLGERFLQLGSGYGKAKKGRKKMSEKDIEDAAQKYATKASVNDPELYETIVEEQRKKLSQGGMQERTQQPKTRGKIFEQKAASLLKQIQESGQKVIKVFIKRETGEMELTFEGGRKETVRVD